MTTHAQTIREAIPQLTDEIVRELDEIMRHSIFHSTLDWQSKAVLQAGAREAFAIYLLEVNDRAKNAPERPQVAARSDVPVRPVGKNQSRLDVRKGPKTGRIASKKRGTDH